MTRLSSERILEAALDLVDEHGLSALSMRKLGAALGVEGMALYRYFPNKDALLDGLMGGVLASVAVPPPTDDPLADCAALARALRSTLMAHPNVAPLLGTRPAVTGQGLGLLEEALARADRIGLRGREAFGAVQTLYVFVIGHVLFHTAPLPASAQALDYDALPASFVHLKRAQPLGSDDEFEAGLALWLRGLR